MKAKLYKALTTEQQDEIYQIVKELKDKVKKKEMTYPDTYMEIKSGPKVKNWLNGIENIDEFYDTFMPLVHKRLLKGYEKIFQKLVDKDVLIAANAGTQLGVVRDGNLIPWDDDIDLVIDIMDYNKYRKKLRRKAIFNGWIPWTKNWIKDDFKNYNHKGMIRAQFTSMKSIKLDFGKFVVRFMPTIDLFPGMRVSRDITQEQREEISYKLIRYYDSCYSNVSDMIRKNQRIKRLVPEYHKMVSEIPSDMKCDISIKKEFEEVIRKYYKKDSDYVMQLNRATPIFSNFDYKDKTKIEVEIKNNKYRFIISDNFEEQFTKEYGEDWKTPRKTHIHFIWIWFTKIKRKFRKSK